MKLSDSDFSRNALVIGAAVIALAGCGGSQLPIGAPAAAQQSVRQSLPFPAASRAAIARLPARRLSSNGDLVYLTTARAVIIVSYPQGQIVGSIPWYSQSSYICSDPNDGNVFIPEGDTIYEYAHGGTSPIATLSGLAGYNVAGCSVDPTTGNLAVATTLINGSSAKGAVLVYPGAKGAPTSYTDKKLHLFDYPAYDDAGNLFVTSDTRAGGFRIAELPVGKGQFRHITLPGDFIFLDKIQWYGGYLTFERDDVSGGGSVIDQVQISGRTATVVNSVPLLRATNRYFWIQDGSVIGQYDIVKARGNRAIAVWPYPSGGHPTTHFYGVTKGREDYPWDLTVSVSPSR